MKFLHSATGQKAIFFNLSFSSAGLILSNKGCPTKWQSILYSLKNSTSNGKTTSSLSTESESSLALFFPQAQSCGAI
jgi:hypothetical protein